MQQVSDQFVAVIEQHKGILYKVANSYASSPEDRDDLVQEIVLQVWRSFSNYKPEFQYSTWIYRIALNVAISFTRKENTRKKIETRLSNEAILSIKEELEPGKETASHFLHQFIHELKPLDKALMLLYLDAKPYQEIAHITGLSETNISTKIQRIKSILKQKFEAIK